MRHLLGIPTLSRLSLPKAPRNGSVAEGAFSKGVLAADLAGKHKTTTQYHGGRGSPSSMWSSPTP